MTQRNQPKIPSVTTAIIVRLIFLKDVRRMRLLLVLMLGLAVVLVLCAQPDRLGDVVPVGLLLEVLCLGVIVQLIITDPAGRDFRFLFTRPVPGTAVLIAKALFFLVFLVVPTGVIHELFVARLGVPLLPLDHLLMFLETTIFAGFQISVIALFCIFFRMHRREMATAGVLCGMGGLLNLFLGNPQRLALLLQDNEAQLWFLHFSDLLFEALVVAVVLVTALIRYRTKRYWLPLGVAATGLALGALGLKLMLIAAPSFHPGFSGKDRLTAEQLSRVEMTLPEVTPGTRWKQHFNLDQDGSKSLFRVVDVAGVQSPYFAFVIGSHTVATLRSGKTLVYDSVNQRGRLPDGIIPDFQAAAVAGAAPKIVITRQIEADLLNYHPGSLQNEDLTGVRLQGAITIRICRAYRVGSTPLKEGESLLVPRHHYTITHAYFSNDGVEFGFDSLHLPLILRGEAAGGITSDNNLKFVVVYRPYNEALHASGGGSNGSSNDFVNVTQVRATCDVPLAGQDPDWRALPPDWSSGADLVFVGSEPCGQITVPYKIDNVDLER